MHYSNTLFFPPQDVCDSQEAWWLRKGCQRARRRLIKSLADAFDIPMQAVQVSSLDFVPVRILHREGGDQQSQDAGRGLGRGQRLLQTANSDSGNIGLHDGSSCQQTRPCLNSAPCCLDRISRRTGTGT
jgi:hypothetical protein